MGKKVSKDKKEVAKIVAKEKLVKAIFIVLGICIGLFLCNQAYKIGRSLSDLAIQTEHKNFNKEEYSEILVKDEEVFGDSYNYSIIRNNEATSSDIIAFFWIYKIGTLLIMIVMLLLLEKLYNYFKNDDLFSDESLLSFKDVVKIVNLMFSVVLVFSLFNVFTVFEYNFIWFIVPFMIYISTLYIFGMLTMANKRIFHTKKVKASAK